jgi:hypothetical protein
MYSSSGIFTPTGNGCSGIIIEFFPRDHANGLWQRRQRRSQTTSTINLL